MKIEQSDIPENIKQIMNSITLFDGKQTMVYETGIDLCKKLADELANKQKSITLGIEMDEKYITMMMDSCPGPQIPLPCTLESIKAERDQINADIQRSKAEGCSEKYADELLAKSRELDTKLNAYLAAKENQEWYRRLYRAENGIKSARNLKVQLAEAESFFRHELPKILEKKYSVEKNQQLN